MIIVCLFVLFYDRLKRMNAQKIKLNPIDVDSVKKYIFNFAFKAKTIFKQGTRFMNLSSSENSNVNRKT